MKKIILASASPRRKALLEQISLTFNVDNCIEEDDVVNNKEPHQLAMNISLKKAQSVAARHSDALIIAADTFGVIGGRIIGKPHSEREAQEILASISGTTHTVITGFTVLDTGTGKSISRSVATTVYMKRLTEEEIEAYIKTGEPMDKAGAYAIQGLGAVLVEKIDGDYSNVMGLPLFALSQALKEFGITFL